MGLSEFRKRKVVRAFHACDLTGDGELTVKDWEERTRRTAAQFGIEVGSARYEQLSKQQTDYWRQYQQVADVNRDNVITLDEWVQAHEQIWAPDMRDSFAAGARATCDALWELIDSDGDGRVNLDEFTRYNKGYVNVGEDESWIAKVFHALDTDGNGTLSKDEYVAAVIDWAYSEDADAPGNGLFGPY